MSIPAVEPPITGGTTGYLPGTDFGGLTGAIDDSAGSGVVIPLGQVDDAYVQWRMTDLTGWDAADLEENAETRTGADGMFDAPNYYGGRTVQVKGLIVAPDAVTLEAAMYRLVQAVPPRRLVTVRFDEATPKYVMARRSGRPMVGKVTDRTAEFDVSLLAPDPRKYAVDATSVTLSIAQPAAGLAPPWTAPVTLPARTGGSDTVVVTNSGIYETQPLIRIAGPGQDLQITNTTTGAFLAYDVLLGATDYLLVDCHAGVALLNGTAPRSPSPGSSVTERFVIVPGDNRLQLTGTATDVVVASATVQFNSAWD
ncbi:phage tail family protein [Actinoallomurus spadix]|uniref:Siphovirus-type tail component C-terminal domain-containing protein n=1 Tax=Actinoallomurus spadix TaxID=79912 RepID=A0ABP3GK83_9ACTN|nr:phage tail domain-containing protein [Actinoallomurus spadix]MCO5986577.1 phage tail family protein [Actinoallomurus spadix]